MAKRTGGFIGQDGINAPDPATGVSASGGDTEATVSFTAPTDVGGAAVTGYRVQSNDGIGVSGSASPITVTGLTNGTSYTFNVWAINPFGWSSPSDASGSVSPAPQDAFFHFGSGNVIERIAIPTTGNSVDYGDLSTSSYHISACGNSTRAVFAGGSAGGDAINVIQFISTSGGGTGSDFGDLTVALNQTSALSNSTTGIIGGGNRDGVSNDDTLNKITIASTGNAIDYGDLTQGARKWRTCASSTRGIFAMGYSTSGGSNNVINYKSISSSGNMSDFGDLTGTNPQNNDTTPGAGCSSSTRGLISGPNNVITYITIASTGNASDFGDMTTSSRGGMGAASSQTRALFIGGGVNIIDYVEIATTGNATDFGDISGGSTGFGAATSTAHGGLS
jgi:hypothetical protein